MFIIFHRWLCSMGHAERLLRESTNLVEVMIVRMKFNFPTHQLCQYHKVKMNAKGQYVHVLLKIELVTTFRPVFCLCIKLIFICYVVIMTPFCLLHHLAMEFWPLFWLACLWNYWFGHQHPRNTAAIGISVFSKLNSEIAGLE